MSEFEQDFIQVFRKQLITYAVIVVFGVIGTAILFYFNTSNALANQQSELRRLDVQQNEIETELTKKISREDYIREIDEMKLTLRSISNKIDRLK